MVWGESSRREKRVSSGYLGGMSNPIGNALVQLLGLRAVTLIESKLH
jgi:hypothetical protein